MCTQKYPNLIWALSGNNPLKNKVLTKYSDNHEYLREQEILIKYLRDNKCTNIKAKFLGGARLFDFYSSIFELNIGKYLVEHGFSVFFIPDKQNMNSLPDIYGIKNKIKCFIEVKSIIEDAYISELMDYLQTSLIMKQPLTIIWNIPPKITKLAFSHVEKSNKEYVLKNGVNELEKEIQNIDVFDYPIGISTSIGSFNIRKGGILGKNQVVAGTEYYRDESFCDKIKRDVLTKLRKHYDLITMKDVIYIIALVLDYQFPINPHFDFHLQQSLVEPVNGLFHVSPECRKISLVIGNDSRGFYPYFNENNPNYDRILNLF